MRKMGNIYVFCLTLGIVLSATAAKAELISVLAANNGAIFVGDKRFDQFEYLKTGDMPDGSQVNVVGYTDGSGNYGLKIQGGFTDLPGGGGSDALVSFRVSVLDPNYEIDGVTLAANPSVIGGGPGFMAITETFLPENGAAILNVFNIVPGSSKLTDSVTFPTGYKVLSVQKDIIAFSIGPEGGIPTMSFFTQVFHQRVVPEPTGLALVGVGTASLVFARWRRRR